jgi:hypothetical protein
MFAQGAERVRGAWSAAGRDGKPRFAALAYFALGPDADTLAQSYLYDYYAFLGDYARRVADGALTSGPALTEAISQFAEAGCDELLLYPCSPETDQLRRLADAALG